MDKDLIYLIANTVWGILRGMETTSQLIHLSQEFHNLVKVSFSNVNGINLTILCIILVRNSESECDGSTPLQMEGNSN